MNGFVPVFASLVVLVWSFPGYAGIKRSTGGVRKIIQGAGATVSPASGVGQVTVSVSTALQPGASTYIQNSTTTQENSVFHVTSGTVDQISLFGSTITGNTGKFEIVSASTITGKSPLNIINVGEMMANDGRMVVSGGSITVSGGQSGVKVSTVNPERIEWSDGTLMLSTITTQVQTLRNDVNLFSTALSTQTNSIRDTVQVNDEGTPQGNVRVLDFVGAGVSESVSGTTATITIAGGGTSNSTHVFIVTFPGDIAVASNPFVASPGKAFLPVINSTWHITGFQGVLNVVSTNTSTWFQMAVTTGVNSSPWNYRSPMIEVSTYNAFSGWISSNVDIYFAERFAVHVSCAPDRQIPPAAHGNFKFKYWKEPEPANP